MLGRRSITGFALVGLLYTFAWAQTDILWQNREIQGVGYAVAYSPDNRYVAAAIGYFSESRVLVWRVEDGTLVYSLPHPNACNDVLFTPDGQHLLSGGNEVRVWRVADGGLARVVPTGNVRRMRLSPDGSVLATAGDTTDISLWRFADGVFLRALPAGARPVFEFTPNGEYLMSALGEATLTNHFQLWRVATGELVRSFQPPFSSVFALSFSPDGAYYATAHTNALALWNAATHALIWSISHNARDVEFSPDGSALAVLGSTGAVELRQVANGALLRTFTGSGGAFASAWDADFSPTGAQITTAISFGSRSVFDSFETTTGRLIRRQPAHSARIDHLAIDRAGRYLTSGGQDGSALWHVANGAPLAVFSGHRVLSVDIAADGSYFAAVAATDASQSTLFLRETETLRLIRTHSDPLLYAVAFTPDSRYIISLHRGTSQGILRFWRTEDGALQRTVIVNGSVSRVRVAPDGQRILVVGFPSTVLNRDGGVAFTLGNLLDAVFAQNGRIIAGVNGNQVFFYDAETGSVLLSWNAPAVQRVAVSPDSRYFLTLDVNYRGELRRTRDGERLVSYQSLGAPLTACAFSPAGELLVFGSDRGDVIAVRNPYPPQPGDVNLDGCVDEADLLRVLSEFGGTAPDADANRDGTVDDADLLLVLFHFGAGCDD